MSQLKSTTSILAFFVMVLIFDTLAETCTPELNELALLEYKTKKSDILAYGYPRHRVRDTSLPNDEVYIVEFEVRCIFKGGSLPETIMIYNVGKKDRMCQETEMNTNLPLIIYLVREGDRLVPSYKEDPGQEQFLEEVPIICGITVSYPNGFSLENNKEECPEEWYDDGDCVPLPADPTTETAPTSQTDMPMDTSTVSTDNTDGKEAPYQPVKSGDSNTNNNENNKEVKIGDEASKERKGGKKSENLEATTPGDRAGYNTPSLIMSLGALAVCLFAYFVRV